MKTIVLCLSAIVIFAASCSKNTTTNTTGRDAFVGNYHMHDSIIRMQCSGCGPNGGNIYDTVSRYYDLQVLAVSGSADKVAFNNMGNYGESDTGTVSGTLATFQNSGTIVSSIISGTSITNTLGSNETYGYGGQNPYVKSTGTKF